MQQHVFDTLWYKAIPGDLKIKQIESKTLDLADFIHTLYLCRDCMTPFFSIEDANIHEKNSVHTKIVEIPFNGIKYCQTLSCHSGSQHAQQEEEEEKTLWAFSFCSSQTIARDRF